jgi:hypothetical protein
MHVRHVSQTGQSEPAISDRHIPDSFDFEEEDVVLDHYHITFISSYARSSASLCGSQ